MAITAVSRPAPLSILIVYPALKPITLATLILVVAMADGTDKVVAGDVRKSLQLLSVSWPSGKRPELVSEAPSAETTAPKTVPGPGAVTKQPPAVAAEVAW